MDDFWSEWKNCARHCWCAYSPNHQIIKEMDAAHVVEIFTRTLHEHGADPDKCGGCLMESGKLVIR